jgi:putative membrane protein
VSPMGDYERDAGLAAERTELAWNRSALSLVACGAVVARGLPEITGIGSRPGPGLVLLGCGVVVWLSGVPLVRRRARAGRQGRRPPARSLDLAPIAYGTALVGVAGFVLAAFTG